MSNSKADKLVKANRLVSVENQMSIGLSASAIEVRITSEYGCAARTVRRDIVAVQKKWAEEASAAAPYRRNVYRTMAIKLYQKSLAADAFGAANQALKTLIDLAGLRTVKIEHEGSVDVKLSREEVDDRINRLAEALDMPHVLQ